jgi:hypothetical protein
MIRRPSLNVLRAFMGSFSQIVEPCGRLGERRSVTVDWQIRASTRRTVMLVAERRDLLLARLRRDGKLVARDPAAELGVSGDSVRRDLRGDGR